MSGRALVAPARRRIEGWWRRWRHDSLLRRVLTGVLLCSALLMLLVLQLLGR